MASRPEVTVFGVDGKAGDKIVLPEVFCAPIRPDVVRTVHRDMGKNSRQAQGVMRRAGHQATAESWGTVCYYFFVIMWLYDKLLILLFI